MEIVISGDVANFGSFKNEKLIEYLSEKVDGLEFYQFQPTPGVVYAASKSWKAIGNISSILGILSTAWMVYSEFIQPKKEKESNSGIIIRIENCPNSNFWIGNDINTEKELLEKAEALLKQYSIDLDSTKKEINMLRKSHRYRKIK